MISKEELLPLLQADRPKQKIIEILDIRESTYGIEGVLYEVDAVIRTERADFDGLDIFEGPVEKLPYPLAPYKAVNDIKIGEMMNKFIKENGHLFKD